MKIWIDAGHGGTDSGAYAGGVAEKEVTLSICLYLEARLEQAGMTVEMTRRTDVYESVMARAAMANDWNGDLFVSVHANAAQSTAATGTEVLSYDLDGASGRLAADIVQAIASQLGLKNRGVKVRRDLAVINATNMPAVLVETAFLTNASDRALLTGQPKAFADAIAAGIFQYLGWEEPEMEKRYQTLAQIPTWAQLTIEKLLARDVFADDNQLDLSLDMVRMFVLLDRYGVLQVPPLSATVQAKAAMEEAQAAYEKAKAAWELLQEAK